MAAAVLVSGSVELLADTIHIFWRCRVSMCVARDNPWTVASALFASMFDDHTIEWLNKRGYLRWDERCRGEAIIAAVNALVWRQR
jgi:hypothetical protein